MRGIRVSRNSGQYTYSFSSLFRSFPLLSFNKYVKKGDGQKGDGKKAKKGTHLFSDFSRQATTAKLMAAPEKGNRDSGLERAGSGPVYFKASSVRYGAIGCRFGAVKGDS